MIVIYNTIKYNYYLKLLFVINMQSKIYKMNIKILNSYVFYLEISYIFVGWKLLSDEK